MWSLDRLHFITERDYLSRLPRSLKQAVVVQYLFDDIFQGFNTFFQGQLYRETKLLYDIAFGFQPRNFVEEFPRSIVYDEGFEVAEMYFITNGTIEIGFTLFNESLRNKSYKMTHKYGANDFIGDYYLLSDSKSQFSYICTASAQAMSLSKKFLLTLFSKYPADLLTDFQQRAKTRYTAMKE